MNLKKQIEDKKIEDIKERTKPADALPLAEALISDKLTDEEKDVLIDDLHKGFTKTGEMLIERCFIEEIMDEKDYLEIKEKYKIELSNFAPVLQAYFNTKDGLFKPDERAVVLTTPNSNIFKARDFIKKKFNVKVISAEEAIKLMIKEKKCQ